jgi:hypothetical protein
MMRDNHRKHEPNQAYEVGAQIHLSYKIFRLISLRMMRPRFLNLHPQLISLFRSCVLMGQAASGHFGIECQCGLCEQVLAIARDVQEFFVTQAGVSLLESGVQAFASGGFLIESHNNWRMTGEPEL